MYYYGDRFAFIAHPRTASRATARALQAGGCYQEGHHPCDNDRCDAIKEAGGIVACTIRNPFDVAVSWYYNQHFTEHGRVNEGTFEGWLKETQLQGNQWLRGKGLYFYGLNHCNRLLRFECLEADLKKLTAEAGIPYVRTIPYGVLPRLRDYRPFYNPETRAIVEERFALDLAKTGYKF